MFDVGASELLLIVIVAIVVIGPKDMPVALRTAGRWIGKIRRVSGHFRTGIETMIREAELEEMEKKWREQNAAIMEAHPDAPEHPEAPLPASAEAAVARLRPRQADPASERPRPRHNCHWGGRDRGNAPVLPIGTIGSMSARVMALITDIDETQAPLLDHLIELRGRLMRCIIALGLAFCVCLYFASDVFCVPGARR